MGPAEDKVQTLHKTGQKLHLEVFQMGVLVSSKAAPTLRCLT